MSAPRRPAVHAGSFYPAAGDLLGRRVDALLEPAPPIVRVPLGLLVPHAGIDYSGRVAACAWSTLRGDPPATVVIAGTNHFAYWFRGVGVWVDGAWESPLGEVAIDASLAAAIAGLGPPFMAERQAHLDEHSIEVQLPFLERACPGTRLVALLVALGRPRACRQAGARLGQLLREVRARGERVVLVASSDFAHYPREACARRVNRILLEPIQGLDAWEVARREARMRRSGVEGLSCGLCGLEPVLFTLAALREMGAARGEVLAEATSAEGPGRNTERTVGYAAVAFVGERDGA